MREYSLLDADYGTLVLLNGEFVAEPARKSMTFGDDAFMFENHLIEKSSLDGAVKIGETRIKSKEATFYFQRTIDNSDVDFRAAENELIRYFLDAVYFYDITNSLRIPIAILDYNIEYGEGGFQLSSDNTIRLQFLEPSWESSAVTNYGESLGLDLSSIEIVNDGFRKVYPVITFTAAAAVTMIKMYVDESKEGLIIEDPLFGTDVYLTLVIDCKNGTIDLEGFDRSIYIAPGTGYFPFPVGVSNLKILPSAVCDVEVDFYKRYFI